MDVVHLWMLHFFEEVFGFFVNVLGDKRWEGFICSGVFNKLPKVILRERKGEMKVGVMVWSDLVRLGDTLGSELCRKLVM